MENDEFIAVGQESVEDQGAEAILADLDRAPSFAFPVMEEYFAVSDPVSHLRRMA